MDGKNIETTCRIRSEFVLLGLYVIHGDKFLKGSKFFVTGLDRNKDASLFKMDNHPVVKRRYLPQPAPNFAIPNIRSGFGTNFFVYR